MKLSIKKIIYIVWLLILFILAFFKSTHAVSITCAIITMLGNLFAIHANKDYNRKSKEEKGTFIFTIITAVVLAGIIAIGAVANTIFVPYNPSKSSSKSTGSYDSNGYYRPSKDEMDDVWNDVYDYLGKEGY